jgi:hypothetical protein
MFQTNRIKAIAAAEELFATTTMPTKKHRPEETSGLEIIRSTELAAEEKIARLRALREAQQSPPSSRQRGRPTKHG